MVHLIFVCKYRKKLLVKYGSQIKGVITLNVTLYTTHCPKCDILEKKMLSKGIPFSVVDNVKEMLVLGIVQAPMLQVDGNLMDFVTANNWVNWWDCE